MRPRPNPRYPRLGALVLALILPIVAAGDNGRPTPHLGAYQLTAAAATWKLPKRLREISGLALTDDQRLLAHNDESGQVYQIDLTDGSIAKSFKLTDQDKAVADDFEGIASAEGRVWLVTSKGRIYECSEGTDDAAVLFTVYTTGLGRDWEIEGLAYDPGQRCLLLAGKNPLSPRGDGRLVLFRWSIDRKALLPGAHFSIPIALLCQTIKTDNFQPSGIERHPLSGHYFIVAARQHAVAEITPGGRLVAVAQLPREQHPQAEGITFAPDGGLLIADEGGDKRGRLTLYAKGP